MAGFEEVRPFEGMGAPIKVRLELRQTFERWLPRLNHSHSPYHLDMMVDELSLLDLCQHYRLEYPGGAQEVAQSWDESPQRLADDGPTFADLVRLGWVFFDGGRWLMQSPPIGNFSDVTYPSPSTKTFLTGLARARLVAKTDTPPSETQALAGRISAENWLDRVIPTKNPDWLAGRLWERLCPKPQPRASDSGGNEMQTAMSLGGEDSVSAGLLEAEAVDRAFLEWSAWCDVLGGVGRWDINWSPIEMRYCHEAAYRVLERQALWGAWDNDASRYAEMLEKTFAIPRDQLRYAVYPRQAPPRTMVSRADWLRWSEVEHLMMARLGASTVSFAFELLCSELERTDIGREVIATATKVISFAAAHPMAFQKLLMRAEAIPTLLVDMLMHPQAASLAAKLSIEWRPGPGRHSDRELSRDAQTRAFAVQDALSLLAYHLSKGALDLEECASLVTWCYAGGAGSKKDVADSRRPIGRQILEMVAKENDELQSVVLRHLVNQAAFRNNVPRAVFAGVLEGLNCLSKAQSIEAFPIVALYVRFARDLHLDWTDTSNLPAELAARLVATALAQDAPERDTLLIPFDIVKRLREPPDDGRLSERSSIAQTLREHVRLLARAAAGWPDEVMPTELSDALQKLISRSVLEHAEKGRVGALTDRYGPIRYLAREHGSPALDLTAAWRRLDSSRQELMLQTLAQSDDPVLLAELCQHLPSVAKPSIRARLRQLKPEEASELWTWPELQRRVESLLAAGEYGLAREHLNEGQEDAEHAPPQFRLGLFGLELQLFLKEKNWAGLDTAVVPLGLDTYTTRQAQNQLDFYRATSQLLRPNGNLAGARVVLQRLAGNHDASSAYRENVFAVAIQQLLGPTLQPLTGQNRLTGESLLAEINDAISIDGKQVSSHLLHNRALLLLVLRRPKDALDSIAARRPETPSPGLEIIAALAKSEMGLRREAIAILDAAILEFGTDEQLSTARKDLEAGEALPSITSATITFDPVSSIRAALQQLAELPPSQVGDVLGPPGRGVRGYLIRQVSRSIAALQHMAAMLRNRKNLKDDAKLENDLNTAVREVLGASLSVVKWDVSDQSLGGATLNGTPGERDAVIRVSGQELSIYEALVCSKLDRSYIKRHFDKLLSYGICDTYFLVTYSYTQKLKPMLDYIREMLETQPPHGLTYISCETLEPPDFETSGYLATYRTNHREVAVVFLIADLKVRSLLAA